MPETLFLRLLTHDDKPSALAAAVDALRSSEACPDVYRVDPTSFRQVPGSPFAYWVGETIVKLFVNMPSLKHSGYDAYQGLITADDFRFIRLTWEIHETRPAHAADTYIKKARWAVFAKGGAFSLYYSDLHLLVDCKDGFAELIANANEKYPYLKGGAQKMLHAMPEIFFYRGITYSRRTQKGLNFRILPEGSVFSDKGPIVKSSKTSHIGLEKLLGLVNSTPFHILVSLQMAFGSYEVGIIQSTPVPPLDNSQGIQLGELALACVELKRDLDRANEMSHAFHLPALLQVGGTTLVERAAAWVERVAEAEVQLATNQREIDDIAYQLYGIAGEDRRVIEAWVNPSGVEVQDEDEAGGSEDETPDETTPHGDTSSLCASMVSYLAGCAFGRFDIRYATGEHPVPVLPDPFAPLPACSPGMLTGANGLPVSKAPPGYPLPIDADGILVDDPGHPDDIVGRVHAALDVIFGERAEAIEREACQILGVDELRDYFRRPGKGGFWDDHIKRYSKSRRKAPIYWLLQSPKRNYALWLFLHRLSNDTLSKALVSYVEPKLRLEEERLVTLQGAKGSASGRELRQAERAIERQESLITDIRELRDRLDRAARYYFTPDLNDGVVLTIAPLHELVPWKEAKHYWEQLLAGKYEWSSIGKQLRAKGMVK